MQPELAFLANRIKHLRLAKKISQEDLAAKAGLSRNGMGLIEQGKRWPRLATLLRISDALGITIEDVLKGIQRGIANNSPRRTSSGALVYNHFTGRRCPPSGNLELVVKPLQNLGTKLFSRRHLVIFAL
jgi:transcriptional regulator with XRE-family HTH domain